MAMAPEGLGVGGSELDLSTNEIWKPEGTVGSRSFGFSQPPPPLCVG